MKLKNQQGFSLLHVLPMIAIVAIVAVIGVKVLTASHAATGYYLKCTATLGAGVANQPINYKVVYKNDGTAASPKNLTAMLVYNQVGSHGGGPAAQKILPSIAAGKSYVWQGTAGPYPKGSYFKLSPFAETLTTTVATCTGARTYNF